jgi:predicted transcriptional regulator
MNILATKEPAMGKTITIRIDEDVYRKIKIAAAAEKRTISNFMEYATLSFIERSGFVSNEEMEAILDGRELMANLKNALKDIEKGSYRIVE